MFDAPVFPNFNPGGKGKLKIPGEKVFNVAEFKLRRGEKL